MKKINKFHVWVDESGIEHFLIAATEDQSAEIQWYNGYYFEIGATNDGVYAGKTNTNLIIGKQGAGSYAAQICADYREGGHDDWYLPSKGELDLLYQQRSVVGGFADDFYWSSTEIGPAAWSQHFGSGITTIMEIDKKFRVRAIRAF